MLIEPISTIPNYFLTKTDQGNFFISSMLRQASPGIWVIALIWFQNHGLRLVQKEEL